MRARSVYNFFYWLMGFTTGCLIVYELSENRHTLIKELKSTKSYYDVRSFTTRNYQLLKNATASQSNSKMTSNEWTTASAVATKSAEWLSCDRVKRVFDQAKSIKTKIHRDENEDGNKGVYFTTIMNQTGHPINVVVKHATIQNASSESHMYRYRSALREIKNLRRLRSLNVTGTSRLLGQCIDSKSITYVVTEIVGIPLCNGNGTDTECALSRKLRSFFQHSHDQGYKSLLWLAKQFEQHQMFLEDVTGVNFYYSPKTLDIYLVDPDSVIFYEDVRLDSRSSCRVNNDCSRPKGNLWRFHALNHKIYYSCQESAGYCYENLCRGYDSAFHTCGVARWLLLPLQVMAPDFLRRDYRRLIQCMMEQYPENRCSMKNCCDEAEKMLQTLLETRRSTKELKARQRH